MSVYLSVENLFDIYQKSSELTYNKKTIDFLSSINTNNPEDFIFEVNVNGICTLTIKGETFKFEKNFYNLDVVKKFRALYKEISLFKIDDTFKISFEDEEFIKLLQTIRVFNEIKEIMQLKEEYIIKMLNS